MTPRTPGMWRILARGWPVMLVVVLGLAAAQALLILGEPATALEPGFVLRVSGSIVALALAGWLLTLAATAAADGSSLKLDHPGIAFWAATAAITASASWIVSPILTPLVLVVVLFLMPASAREHPLRTGLRAARRHPWRATGAVLVTLLLSVIGWVAGLIFGFFVTGPRGTFLAWTVAGVTASVVIAMWASLLRRPAASSRKPALDAGS
jgi:hypothetical protein